MRGEAEWELIPGLPEDVALECLLRVSYKQFPQLQGVCRKWERLVKSREFYEARKKAGTSRHYVCMVQALPAVQCGMEREKHLDAPAPVFGVSMYDLQQQIWDRLPPIPDFPLGLPLFCRCVAVDGHVIVLGGWHPDSYEALTTVYVLNFFSQTWRRGADMPTVRSFFACGAMEGRVFVAGGHDDNKNALSTAEVYNVEDDCWHVLPHMSQERDECGGVVIDGKFLVISGYTTDSQGQFCGSAEILDVQNDCWNRVEDFWMTGLNPGPFAVLHGQLHAIQRRDLLRYCPLKNVWFSVSKVPEGGRVAPCATAIFDSIFVMGSPSSNVHTKALTYKANTGNGMDLSGIWHEVENNGEFVGVGHSACAVEV